MEKEVIEYGKKRVITIDRGYSYQESVKDTNGDDYVEFFSMVKESDYSFYYFNGTMVEKTGEFKIEADSIFINPFLSLLGDDLSFEVEDDYTERSVVFRKAEDGGVIINVNLLPGETDGSIELKNIMFDTRSKADSFGTDTKSRLSNFFDELVLVNCSSVSVEEKKLIKS